MAMMLLLLKEQQRPDGAWCRAILTHVLRRVRDARRVDDELRQGRIADTPHVERVVPILLHLSDAVRQRAVDPSLEPLWGCAAARSLVFRGSSKLL